MTNSIEIVSKIDFEKIYLKTEKIGVLDDSPEARDDYNNFLSPRVALHLYDTAKYLFEEYQSGITHGKDLILDYLPAYVKDKPKSFLDAFADKFQLLANNLAEGKGIELNCIADEVSLTITYLEASAALEEYGSLEEVLSYYDQIPDRDERDKNFPILLEHYLENFDASLLQMLGDPEEENSILYGIVPETWFLPY